MRIGLTLPLDADVRDLRESLAKDTGIPVDQVLIVEIDSVTFKRTLHDGQSVSQVGADTPLYCIETPKVKLWIHFNYLCLHCWRFRDYKTNFLVNFTLSRQIKTFLGYFFARAKRVQKIPQKSRDLSR